MVAAAVNMELTAGMVVDGFVLESKIGEGGMGVVYSAHHSRIGKRVAIKVLSPAYCDDATTVERFEQEGRLVNEIRHPNIVDVFQFGELPDGRSFIVMEMLEGESLGARIDRGPLPATDAMDILDEICDALDAAHEKGVVHRDIKSDNVFLVDVRGKRKVKLLDFGLAKLARLDDPASIHRTKSGILVGTPAYMSPEQARGKSVDHRTDIYALGCLTYKMLTGALPFIADNPMDLIVKQLNDPPPSPLRSAPATPLSLARIVVQMMAKSPDERPSIAEIRQTLANLRDSPAVAAPKPRRALSILLGVMLFCSGVITIGVIGLLKQRDGGTAVAAPPAIPEPAPTPVEVERAPIAEPVIEMEPVPVRRGSSAPRPSTPPTPAPVVEPAQPAAVILVMLERDAQIEIDGHVVANDTKGGRFEVPPGTHTVRILAPGRETVMREIDVEAGATAALRIGAATKAPDTENERESTDDGVDDPTTDHVVPQD